MPEPPLPHERGLHAASSALHADQPGLRARRRSQGSQIHVPIHVFIQQVAEAFRAAGVAGLRAKGAEPHIISGLDLNPILVEPVDGLAFQNIEAVFHHMGLYPASASAQWRFRW